MTPFSLTLEMDASMVLLCADVTTVFIAEHGTLLGVVGHVTSYVSEAL